MNRTAVIVFSVMLTAILLVEPVSTAARPVSSVSIRDIQYTTDPSGDSPMAGLIATTAGVVTSIDART